ncbi:MAG: sensor histidine kinase [Vulcanimicrobiaceae bacterium]
MAKAQALAEDVLAAGSCIRASVLLFVDDGVVEATAPEGTGFSLRAKTPEMQRLFLHALSRFAIPDAFFVPRTQARALAGITTYRIENDLLVVPLQAADTTHGAIVLDVDELPPPEDLHYLRAYSDIAASIVAHERTVSAVQREARQSTLLALINERMRKSLDRNEILRAVAEDVRAAFEAARCVIYERDRRRSDTAIVVVAAESREIDEPMPKTVPIKGSWVERAFAGSVISREVVGDAPYDEHLRALNVQSALLVPFFIEGKVESAMALYFARPRAFDDVDLVMLRSIAFHVGLALANVRLYERERLRRSRAEALERVTRILRDTQYVEETLLVFAVTASLEANVACAVYELEGSDAVRRALRDSHGQFVPPERVPVPSLTPLSYNDDMLPAATLPKELRVPLFGDTDGLLAMLRVDGVPWGFVTFFGTGTDVDWGDAEQRAFLRTIAAHLELSLSSSIGLERVQQLARALSESSEFKDDLMAMLAHDFKGPLTVILGYCELLLEMIGENGREEIETIFSQTQRLVRLSEDAVALAQTQAGGFSLNRTRLDLREFVAASVSAHNRVTERIVFEAPESPITVSLDTQRFNHVLDNLLMNALKYSTDEVIVRLSASQTQAILQIVDRGIGIPASEITTVFTRFGRATNARRKGIAGSGVGLYVASKIVEVHRGSIAVDSVEDEGSTFTITLPLAT